MAGEKKRAIVTGGAGFIGSWLCDRLVEEDYNVICIDNLGSGSRKNIEHLLRDEKFEFIEHDVKDPMKIDRPVDYVFHLASRASPVDFQRYAVDILLTNSLGTRNALEIAKEKNARFLLASSSEVYGDPLEHPQMETYRGNVNPVGPRSCYDEAKRFAEAMTITFYREYGLDARIARIFNTYGPRMKKDDGRVIPTFITQAIEGKPITVYGNGSQSRSFCYITDMVEGLMKLMFADDASGQIVNLGYPNEISILEVAHSIKKTANSTSEILFKPLPVDDPARRKPDITKAKALLGWAPTIQFEDGLLRTIVYFREVVE
jgi:nucleoside-diphosphate-sugar epimerase